MALIFLSQLVLLYGASLANSWVLRTAAQTGYTHDVYIDKMFWDAHGALISDPVSIQHDNNNDGIIFIFKGIGEGDGAAIWNGAVYHHIVGDPLYQKYQTVQNFIDNIAGATGVGTTQAPGFKTFNPLCNTWHSKPQIHAC